MNQKKLFLKHFIDSITIKVKIVDIGTGAGFPGIPLKIVKENSKVSFIRFFK